MSAESGTVDKALSLLDFFSEDRPLVGLSDLARDAGFNKATTLRFLNSLRARGFVEQDGTSKAYHLGPAVLRLARVREASVPPSLAVERVLSELMQKTGETALASVISGDVLTVLQQVESRKSNRVIIDTGKPLPFHATASGLAFLAFAAPDVAARLLGGELARFAPRTPTARADVESLLADVRDIGHATVRSTYEEDVVGIAAPYFGPSGKVCGAVASAIPQARLTPALEQAIAAEVRAAARRLTAARGGIAPPSLPA